MDSEQTKIYRELETSYDLPGLLNETSQNKSKAFAKIIRLRQAASNPRLLATSLKDYYEYMGDDFFEKLSLDDSLMTDFPVKRQVEIYKKQPKKYIELRNLVSKILDSNGRAVIWCEFIFTIHELSDYMKANGISHRLLYGAIEKNDREEIVHEFQKSKSSFNIIIANPHAVGESISLHQNCHNAIYFEMSFNAAAYMQSKDRIHRVGLEPDTITNYYFIVSKDTIEESIVNRVIEKEQKMMDIIERYPIPLIANNSDFLEDSTDDLKLLIKDYYARNKLG
jgi:SNF2 family DNA or RNA helicase